MLQGSSVVSRSKEETKCSVSSAWSLNTSPDYNHSSLVMSQTDSQKDEEDEEEEGERAHLSPLVNDGAAPNVHNQGGLIKGQILQSPSLMEEKHQMVRLLQLMMDNFSISV